MTVDKEGTKYTVQLSDGTNFPITFCHKDETGVFQHGITHELLVEVLMDRFKVLVRRSPTPSNMEVLTLLTQMRSNMKRRSKSKNAFRNNKTRACTA